MCVKRLTFITAISKNGGGGRTEFLHLAIHVFERKKKAATVGSYHLSRAGYFFKSQSDSSLTFKFQSYTRNIYPRSLIPPPPCRAFKKQTGNKVCINLATLPPRL